MRIVSLEPSITAMLFALGAQEQVIAVSAYCHRVADVGDRPQLAPTWSARPEDLADLEPDLVIAAPPYRVESVAGLLQTGLNVLCLYPKRLDDLYRHLHWLGRLAGVDAGPIVSQLQAGFAAVEAQARAVPTKRRPRVYVEMWPNPMMSSPQWVAELVAMAGGQFVPVQPGRQVTSEEIIAADPEIIIVAWAGVENPSLDNVRRRPGWDQITAVAADRVAGVDEIHLNAPGPNLIHGARQLAAIIGRNR